MSTLYLARLCEMETVTSPAGQPAEPPRVDPDQGETDNRMPASPYGRVVVECVTVHPDAGMPPTSDEGGDHGDERRFVARLLADARDELDEDDALDRHILAVRRLHTVDILFDDDFWVRHHDAWWAQEPVVADSTLRDWLSGPSDGAPYQVAAFEAFVRPACLPGLAVGTFTSAAYW